MDKTAVLDELYREQAQWEALLAQIGETRMDQPGVAGTWSTKDIVAHLTGWRRRTVARLQAAQHGQPEPAPHWPAELQSDDEINAWLYETNHHRTVREVLDESRQVFQQLVASIEGLSETELQDPQRFPWLEGQPLSEAKFFGHFHEEHEPDMRAWLGRHAKP